MFQFDDIYAQNEEDFINAMKQVQKELLREIKAIMGDFSTYGGLIDNSPEEMQRNLILLRNIDQALQKTGFNEAIEDGTIKLRKFLGANLDQYKGKFKALGQFDETAIDGLIVSKYESLNDIGTDALFQVKQQLINSITIGQSMADATSKISEILDERLKKYAETYYRTAMQEYRQAATNFIADKIGFGEEKSDIWVYVGAPLQENSHDECIWALTQHGRLFTNEEKKAFERGSAYPGQPAPPRYNCQHEFQISDYTLEDYEKQNR